MFGKPYSKLPQTKKFHYESLIGLQLVFAETEETISGGNFHGEYPAKVKAQMEQILTSLSPVVVLGRDTQTHSLE